MSKLRAVERCNHRHGSYLVNFYLEMHHLQITELCRVHSIGPKYVHTMLINMPDFIKYFLVLSYFASIEILTCAKNDFFCFLS